MKVALIFTVFLCGLSLPCFSQNYPKEIHYHLSEVEKVEPWLVKNPSYYQGDYYAEDGSRGGSLHLIFYHDGKDNRDYYDGCLIFSEDVAVKPQIQIIRSIVYDNNKKSLYNNAMIFIPARIKISGNNDWVYGLIYNSLFYEYMIPKKAANF